MGGLVGSLPGGRAQDKKRRQNQIGQQQQPQQPDFLSPHASDLRRRAAAPVVARCP